jgi:hypothetical protein
MCEWTALLVVAAVVAIAWCAWRTWRSAPPAPYAPPLAPYTPPLAGVDHIATVLEGRYDSDNSGMLTLVLAGEFVPVGPGCRGEVAVEMGNFLAGHEWIVQRVHRSPGAVAGGMTTVYLTTPSPPSAAYNMTGSPLGVVHLRC